MQKSPRSLTSSTSSVAFASPSGCRTQGCVGPPGMSPRMVRMCRMPASAYDPTTRRSRSRDWLAQVRWAIVRRVVFSAMARVTSMVRSRVEPLAPYVTDTKSGPRASSAPHGVPQHPALIVVLGREQLEGHQRPITGVEQLGDGRRA